MNNSPTVLQINSKAIRHNLQYFRSKLKTSTKLLVIIKAFAYGSDPVAVAKLLTSEKVDYLAVADTQEGVVLRKTGIDLPIIVLHSQAENFEWLVEHNLEPDLYNFESFISFYKLIKSKGLKDYPVHIKLNTGMNRLGFKPFELDKLRQIITNQNYLKIRSVYSHLAASEDPEERKFTLQQIDLYKKMYDQLTESLTYKPLKHISNTSGILNYPEAHFDMVRLGIGFYGFGNNKTETAKLKNVCNLISKISQIQELEKGETVSYNRRFVVKEKSKVAVIPLGYADGISRGLSNGKGYVIINRKKAFITGAVCMDIFMVDVSNIDCKTGDKVIIFDHQQQILDFAKQLKTIPYEIITSISQRVRRDFI
ncbi:MAG: alanine racemase [Flavobacteriia bacterium]|nr:MAG: alanine racemase [Flavobacteriia bacterium]